LSILLADRLSIPNPTHKQNVAHFAASWNSIETIRGTICLLRALLKRELEIEPLAEPAPRRPTLKAVASPKPSPKRRAKSFPVYRLYPAAEPEPYRQAETMLREIQRYAEDAIGKYIPAGDLERLYGELCERENWEAHHWTVMGHELAKLTERVCKKSGTKRFMAYKISRARA
jgi:hypothetical protein